MDSKYISTRRIFWYAMMIAAYIVLSVLCNADNSLVAYSARVARHSYLISLTAAWATSIQRRITNRRVRHFLLHIAGAISIWLTIRTLKFYVFDSALANRYLWYMYYIPQLLIAFYSYALACFIGKNDNEKTPKRLGVFLTITIALIVGMMTNELHGLALYVDPVTGAEGHRILYYISTAWMAILILMSLLKIPKHRDEGVRVKKILWPYLFIFLGGVYCVIYIIPATSWIRHYLEYTITICTLIILCFETLMQGGFIQGNKDYEWCFKNSTIRGQIFDSRGNKVYQSHVSRALGEDDWYKLSQYGRFKPERNTEMLLARIRGGFVVWEKDIHDINHIMDNLLETRESIKAATGALQETIEEEIRHNKIKEQNRLYDKVSAGVGPKFEELAMWIKFAQNATGDELRMLIKRIDIMGVYAKRKSNLILLSEKSDADFNMELELCFKESFDNLNQAGVSSGFRVRLAGPLSFNLAVKIYDLLEVTIEAALSDMKGVLAIVSGDEQKQSLMVNLNFDSDESCETVARQMHEKMTGTDTFLYEIEDGSLNVLFEISGEGGADL